MQPGSVILDNVSVGGLNLIGEDIYPDTIRIYEDILDPLGAKASIFVTDMNDSIGRSGFVGSDDDEINISFTEVNRNISSSFNLRTFEGANLTDSSEEETSSGGSGNIKTYEIRCVSPEYNKNLDSRVERSFNDYTTNIVRDILRDVIETENTIEIQEQSTNRRRFVFSDTPLNVLKDLNDEHVGNQSKSSAFLTFQQQKRSNTKYLITTFERLFKQGPVQNLYRDASINFGNASSEVIMNSIMRMNVDTSFFPNNRFLTSTVDKSYNPSTGVVHDSSEPLVRNFTTPSRMKREQRNTRGPILRTSYDALNDPNPLTTSEARALRAQFVAQISENYAEFMIHGNPNISVGDMVNLNIPNISISSGSRERIFSGNALVVSITHTITQFGDSPRYTMSLGCVRAGIN